MPENNRKRELSPESLELNEKIKKMKSGFHDSKNTDYREPTRADLHTGKGNRKDSLTK